MADIDLEELERLANELDSDTLERFLTDFGRSMRAEALADSVPALIAEARRVPALEEEVRRLWAEVARRPDISPEDARLATDIDAVPILDAIEAGLRIKKALRAHAAKTRKGGE